MEWGVEGVNMLRLGSLPLGLAGRGGFGGRFLLAGASSRARGTLGKEGQSPDLDSVFFIYIMALVAEKEFVYRHIYVSSPAGVRSNLHKDEQLLKHCSYKLT